MAQADSEAWRGRHLLANTMPHWDDPELRLYWLMPLLGEGTLAGPSGLLFGFMPQAGDRHPIRAAAGIGVVLQAAS